MHACVRGTFHSRCCQTTRTLKKGLSFLLRERRKQWPEKVSVPLAREDKKWEGGREGREREKEKGRIEGI